MRGRSSAMVSVLVSSLLVALSLALFPAVASADDGSWKLAQGSPGPRLDKKGPGPNLTVSFGGGPGSSWMEYSDLSPYVKKMATRASRFSWSQPSAELQAGSEVEMELTLSNVKTEGDWSYLGGAQNMYASMGEPGRFNGCTNVTDIGKLYIGQNEAPGTTKTGKFKFKVPTDTRNSIQITICGAIEQSSTSVSYLYEYSTKPAADLRTESKQALDEWLGQYSRSCFGKVVSLGNTQTYKAAADRVNWSIDPEMEASAKYVPGWRVVWDVTGGTVKIRYQPSAAKANPLGIYENLKRDIWHEVTHSIEDANGDLGVSDDEVRRERNVDYMLAAVQQLDNLLLLENTMSRYSPEDRQRKLREVLDGLAAARAKLENAGGSVDAIKTWAGFNVNPDEILAAYEAGCVGGPDMQQTARSVYAPADYGPGSEAAGNEPTEYAPPDYGPGSEAAGNEPTDYPAPDYGPGSEPSDDGEGVDEE